MSDLTNAPPPGIVRRAGWYPDPTRASAMRWWDGESWTERVREHEDGGVSSLAKWGFVAALLMPAVGFVIAIVLLARSEVGPGLAVLLTCGVGMMLALALLA